MSSTYIHRKPIGESGPVVVGHAAGEPTVKCPKIDYEPEKSAQELAVAKSFVSVLNSERSSDWNVCPLTEDNFDFELVCAAERRYLELQEIVIPGKKRGSPYARGEQVIRSEKLADTILSEIRKKAVKYPSNLSQPLDLLVYGTHWRFLPNKTVLQLVAYGLGATTHPFSKGHFFTRLNPTEGRIVSLFPSSDLIQRFDPRTARGNRYINFDPGSGVPFRDGDKIGVRLNLSPDAVQKFLREP
jgi:hypothetical protein